MAIKTRVFVVLIAVLAIIHVSQPLNAQSAKGLRTVVIDPGHGGEDTGALGLKKASTGYHEKDIVLSVSLLLGEKIKAAYPDVKVMYTRDRDVFISRNDRAKLANQYADLFISIHCNGNNNLDAHGTSVHILGQKSKNTENKIDYFEENQSVAKRRNDLIVVDGDDVKTKRIDSDQASGHISGSLQWKAIYESSLLFATEVIDKLIKEPLTPREVVLDQDVFDVLAYTSRPAVLLELGFVTNAKEYAYLKTAEAQEEIAERLFQAFAAYKPVYDASFAIDFGEEEAGQDVQTAADYIYYGIQIMCGSRALRNGDPAFKGFEAYSVPAGNVYKYIIGRHETKEEAQAQLSKVRRSFPDAFVVKVQGDKVSRP
ncbi:MAG: N-acetylmuramoyl-L-alanine amidase [Bacteroidales bacterium]|nr:N-acetylmuramoyl-L-alanine amidase [Bacteroidales bacterium]